MIYFGIVISIILILIISYFGFFISLKKQKKLSKSQVIEFQKILKKISTNISSKEKIIDADKLFHKILLSYGYIGTFGEILKQEPKIISDIDKVWELHKLRNKLAHDFDLLEERALIKKSKEYILEINNLFKKIS
ncbi:MAG: hypothetical protein PHE25_01580 [Candidatus Gracilibacteria bacterium]|nr:hypothetical protein [Candidatus Gracilibacteria bacterium]